jgi:type II secretion system protein C
MRLFSKKGWHWGIGILAATLIFVPVLYLILSDNPKGDSLQPTSFTHKADAKLDKPTHILKPARITRERKTDTIQNRDNLPFVEEQRGKSPEVNNPPQLTSNLDLRLVGTVVGGSKNSWAVIEDLDMQEGGIYRIGDTIKGATIEEILRDKVILQKGNKKEILPLMKETGQRPRESSLALASRDSSQEASQVVYKEILGDIFSHESLSSPEIENDDAKSPIKQLNNNTWQISPNKVFEMIKNAPSYANQVWVMPYLVSHEPAGFKLLKVDSGSDIAKLGFRSGDIVKKVNGIELYTPLQVLKGYYKLKNESLFRVELERGNKVITLNYAIK